MATSDVDQLVEMGFDKERAEMAISRTGSLQNSLEWLEEHQDKSIEEIKESSDEPPALQPGEEARSLVCNDCGKKFRGQSQAEFHASKLGHVDFAESTEEIAPLTEEEKKQKLEDLRAKLAEKRAGQSVQEKEEKKRNEEIRRKNTQASQDAKEELRKKEQMKQAAKKKIEMQEEIEAKKRIRAKIEADKEERRLRAQKDKAEREGKAPPPPPPAEPAPTTSGPVASKPASAYTETRLRLQTSNGNVMKTFPVDTTLFEVAASLNEESGVEVQSFTQNFPKKVYNTEFFGETLKELGFVPSASLLVA